MCKICYALDRWIFPNIATERHTEKKIRKKEKKKALLMLRVHDAVQHLPTRQQTTVIILVPKLISACLPRCPGSLFVRIVVLFRICFFKAQIHCDCVHAGLATLTPRLNNRKLSNCRARMVLDFNSYVETL